MRAAMPQGSVCGLINRDLAGALRPAADHAEGRVRAGEREPRDLPLP